jgi:hypothetical protein
MASQGPFYASTVVNDATIGTVAWTNPGNAQGAPNATYAQFATPAYKTFQSTIRLYTGSFVGTNQSSSTEFPSSLAFVSVGGSANSWGATLTSTSVNSSNFGFGLSVVNNSGTVSKYLLATNFGFSIPAGATINGVLAEIDCYEAVGATTITSNSFTKNTLIQTNIGLIPIQDIKPGHIVKSFSEDGTEFGYSEVLQVTSRITKETLVINGELECTFGHQLFTNKGFVDAIKIKKGDYLKKIVKLKKGEKLKNVKVKKIIKKENTECEVYSFSTDNHHTYFANQYAVHNASITLTGSGNVDAVRLTVYYTPGSPTPTPSPAGRRRVASSYM